MGYRVSCWTDSVEALEAFKDAPEKYDLVVSDMTMPRLRGDKLASQMLAIKPDIPIVLSTGFSQIVDETSAIQAGIKALVKKPIKKNELSRIIRDVLDCSKL